MSSTLHLGEANRTGSLFKRPSHLSELVTFESCSSACSAPVQPVHQGAIQAARGFRVMEEFNHEKDVAPEHHTGATRNARHTHLPGPARPAHPHLGLHPSICPPGAPSPSFRHLAGQTHALPLAPRPPASVVLFLPVLLSFSLFLLCLWFLPFAHRVAGVGTGRAASR